LLAGVDRRDGGFFRHGIFLNVECELARGVCRAGELGGGKGVHAVRTNGHAAERPFAEDGQRAFDLAAVARADFFLLEVLYLRGLKEDRGLVGHTGIGLVTDLAGPILGTEGDQLGAHLQRSLRGVELVAHADDLVVVMAIVQRAGGLDEFHAGQVLQARAPVPRLDRLARQGRDRDRPGARRLVVGRSGEFSEGDLGTQTAGGGGGFLFGLHGSRTET
jgi:hypothetical protein